MADSSAPTIQAPPKPASRNPRLVDACPACAYDLTGLSDEGVCPECGAAYDQSVLVLTGHARGELADLTNTAGNRFVWRAAFAAALVLAYAWNSSLWRGQFDPFWIVMAAWFMITIAIALARRFDAGPKAGKVDVYLGPGGLVQRNADDRAFLAHLGKLHHITLVVGIAVSLLYSWVGRNLGGGVAAVLLVGLPLASLGMTVMLAAGAARADASAAAAQRYAEGYWPWTDVPQLTLERVDDAHHRIRAIRPGNWRKPTRVLVDAEVRCTPAKATLVRRLIAQWRAAAGAEQTSPPD